ncbi:flagellar assembly protein FliH [Sulfurimonas autotrophica]|uniref:Flagellar assembly protein FliH n=1 Tax=Sulfurimonas autotrophica (strain ATCC BAA-671 / DSM 16294 / JCM 11897 / OK10) TaxID=563040 RepID=E0UPG2_SULAO|nr:flagellar assembly protein FliH [Sulfurimonas autotrophica]ADN09692.1 Flagellar assembly protein FliH/Type III secretion system HrpE [Sulfurimonas autotrophica DSM 16294]
MATIISSNAVDEHNVHKYSFKVIAMGLNEQQKSEEKVFTADDNPKARVSDVDSSALSTSSKDSLIESLMKKTDEMSSNFIKLQMKLEAKEEEFQEELKKVQEEAFDEGLKAGEAKAREEIDKALNNKLELLTTSIQKLEESAGEFEKALEGVKSELLNAALDIAKEVIQIEVSENSVQVAKTLSDELMKELQSASKITLKVNPKDHSAIVEHLGKLEHVEVLPDSAVSEGGVIALSDAGNIDAQISKRFERVKKAALSG